jgi:translation initiation factor IF-3
VTPHLVTEMTLDPYFIRIPTLTDILFHISTHLAMTHLRSYSARNAIFEAFIRPAIGLPRCLPPQLLAQRTFIPTPQCQQKLSRKQREQTGALTPEDQERLRKAREKAERRVAAVAPRPGPRAKALLVAIGKEPKALAAAADGGAEERPLENDEIKNTEISLVDAEGRFHKRVNTREILWRLNRAEEKLLVVKAAEGSDPRSMPLCKIFPLEELLKKEKERKSREAQRERGEKTAKEMEVTWTIGPADMDLKCRQMSKFLGEGRKVDVTINRRYRRRVPDKDQDELQGVVNTVRAAALGVNGAREYRLAEGRLAESMLLFFEGPRGGVKDQIEDAGAADLPEPEIAGAAAS